MKKHLISSEYFQHICDAF